MASTSRQQVVAVCDPVSTGGAIAAALAERGFLILKIWTRAVTADFKDHVPSVAKEMKWLGEIDEKATLKETCEAVSAIVGNHELVGVVVGGETGVVLADELSEAFGLRTNGTACTGRRNKSEQQKIVKAAGLRSTREASGTELDHVREFLKCEPMPCIVKPTESCGSDGVKKCSTIEEAEAHFELLMRSQKKAGAQDCAVICQEFLAGEEYVVDHVSRDGVHKTVMVWVYDKRPTNGGEFVYYNMLPVESSHPIAEKLISYTRGVIDALDIKHGPTHAEVMLTADGTPCLVEMNCRAHGWDGAWAPLERALVGYSQVETACDCYFDGAAFAALPDVFPSFMAGGQMVELVSNFTGRIEALPGYDIIKTLPSFNFIETGAHIAVGQQLELTIDLFTCAGAVILCHPDKAQVAADEARIRAMELDGSLFQISAEEPVVARKVVAVCDPVSTGGAIAAELASRGYSMLKVWTNSVTDEFKDHVPSVAKDLQWFGEVTEKATLQETCSAISSLVGNWELVGVVVGGETGVTLADELSEAFALRTNGTACKGRRDKSEQQKLVKNAGLRSTREASGTELAHVRDFLQKEPMPCIVKPTESCGSDGVKKCSTIEEAEAHFELLMRSQKKAGAQDCAVICQEFLAGEEYVVDHISRDGVHKTVMVWVYDKRPTNGGEFVYYNMLPVESSDPVAQRLISYTRGVIDALDIKHGPTHAEVMLTADGTPCLVEMNCRAHGWDGAWAPLEKALVGYSQVETACDCYFDGAAFDALPDVFPRFAAGGQMVELVSNFTGHIEALPGYDAIKQMASFNFMEVGNHIGVGQHLELTIDLFTSAGAVILCHADKEQVKADEATIREMESTGSLFQLS